MEMWLLRDLFLLAAEFFVPLKLVLWLAQLQRNFPIPCPAEFEMQNVVNSHS